MAAIVLGFFAVNGGLPLLAEPFLLPDAALLLFLFFEAPLALLTRDLPLEDPLLLFEVFDVLEPDLFPGIARFIILFVLVLALASNVFLKISAVLKFSILLRSLLNAITFSQSPSPYLVLGFHWISSHMGSSSFEIKFKGTYIANGGLYL